MKKMIKADFRSDHRAALERGRQRRKQGRASKQSEIIEKIKNADNRLEAAFEELVPPSGKADTKAGELVRAMMRIVYRDFNDGDVFYEGYGVETCGEAVAFLCDKVPQLEDKFAYIAQSAELGNDEYTRLINNIADDLITYILENPELISEKNNEDMFDYDGEGFIKSRDWVPKYELTIDIPESVHEFVDAGYINMYDIDNEISSWDWQYNCPDGTCSVSDGVVYLEELDKDTYEELEDNMYDWLEGWADDLRAEYGDPQEYGEDEDDDEEW